MSTKKLPETALGIRIRNPDEEKKVVYARVRPVTQTWLASEQAKSGAKSMGEYLDALVEYLRVINKENIPCSSQGQTLAK